MASWALRFESRKLRVAPVELATMTEASLVSSR
jgi:hypothetical protein